MLEIPAILQNLVASAIEITDSTAGTVGLIVNEKMVFSKYYEHGKLIPIDYVFEKGYGVPGLVMETKKPYLSNDAQHDPYVIQEIRKTLGLLILPMFPYWTKKVMSWAHSRYTTQKNTALLTSWTSRCCRVWLPVRR